MKKNNLDEMQEKKMLHLEHNGYWIAFWGLLAAIYIQIAMGNGSIAYIGGEAVLLVIISVYLWVGCMKNGLWDRTLKPNAKTNLMASLITGAALAVFWFVVSYRNYHVLAGSLAAAVFMFLLSGIGVYVLLSLSAALYKKRHKQLEEEEEES